MIQEQTDTHRSEFEQWAAKIGLRMTKRGNGDYVAPFTAIAWKAWQAAKAQISVSLLNQEVRDKNDI